MAGFAASELQDDFLNAVRTSQGVTLQALRTWVAIVEPVTSKAFFMPLPLGSDWAKPEVFKDSYFDFAGKLLDNQRQFAQEWLEATAPLIQNGGAE
jgi:hypothetical protein